MNKLVLNLATTFSITFTFINCQINEQKILNMLKESTLTYGKHGKSFPAGYHTVILGKKTVKGRRNPSKRISLVPYNFKDKVVLDLGCNAGGMLLSIANKVKHGIGIDYNPNCINCANRLRSYNKHNNLDFFCFDLNKESLYKIKNFIPYEKVDICFMLSLCYWIPNWKKVADFAASISNAMLFEAHGKKDFQNEQINYIQKLYKTVNLISPNSNDDPKLKSRQLYLCLK